MPLVRIYKFYFSPQRKFIRSLSNMLGFVPGNVSLYRMAFRHRSASVAIKSGVKSSNERLEFLGDAVLGSVIAEVLFKLYPYREEGFLTEMRSKIVNRANLNQLSRKLGFDKLIEYDARTVGANQGSMTGDAFEALIGAVYLDKGYNFTRAFLKKTIIAPHVDIFTLEQTETNYKSKLIEWCQRHGKDVIFELVDNAAGDNSRLFNVQVVVDGEQVGTGCDYNKKNAEKLAAEKACARLIV